MSVELPVFGVTTPEFLAGISKAIIWTLYECFLRWYKVYWEMFYLVILSIG